MTLPSPLPYQFEDPLGGFASFSPPLATTSTTNVKTSNAIGLSAWHCRGNDDDDDDSDDDGSEDEYDSEDDCENDDDGQRDHRRGWHNNTSENTSLGKHSVPSSPITSSSTQATVVVLRATRVRFEETPQICCFERIDRDLFSRLFYSCHELQKIMDEANQEKKNDPATVVQSV